jgi:hypothetical protein
MAELDNVAQFREISYNLDIVEKTLKTGKAVDIGFVEIFANDIAKLRDKKLQNQLSTRLTVIAAKIYDVTEGQFFPSRLADTARPLVGKAVELKQIAAEYTDGKVKTRLEKLDSSFVMKPIAGDGHCLFRAVAVGILEFLQKNNASIRESFLSRIHAVVEKFKATNPTLEIRFQEVLEILNDLSSKTKSLEEVLNNRQTSDILVSFLRELAVSYNEVEGGATFESEAIVEEGSKEAYLRKMKDMRSDTPALGGEPELIALMRTLDIELINIDAASEIIDRTDPQNYLDRANKANKLALFLLHRPGHYDLAFAKGP